MPMIDACPRRAARSVLVLSLGFVLSLGALATVKPAQASDAPGSIIRVWPLDGGGPGGGDAFRILYRSGLPASRSKCQARSSSRRERHPRAGAT